MAASKKPNPFAKGGKKVDAEDRKDGGRDEAAENKKGAKPNPFVKPGAKPAAKPGAKPAPKGKPFPPKKK